MYIKLTFNIVSWEGRHWAGSGAGSEDLFSNQNYLDSTCSLYIRESKWSWIWLVYSHLVMNMIITQVMNMIIHITGEFDISYGHEYDISSTYFYHSFNCVMNMIKCQCLIASGM